MKEKKNLFDVHGLLKDSSVFNELKSHSTGDVIPSNRFNGSPMSEDRRSKQIDNYQKNLGFSCGVRKYSMQGILDLKLAT